MDIVSRLQQHAFENYKSSPKFWAVFWKLQE
jgi:hypothetical protein